MIDIETLKEYIKVLEDSSLSCIEISDEENSIRLEREYCAPGEFTVATDVQTINDSAAFAPADSGKAIKSPMVGVFYSAPAPDKPAFVSVGDNAVIGDGARLYPHVCIGDNAKVGNNSTLHSGVKLYAECVVGNDCIIHAGTVIGADGFGFASQNDTYLKVPQIGNVVIEDNVEIGANTCIDRATMGSTRIHKNVKLDNLIQVAHNVEIGEGSAAAAQVGIAGSAKIGKHCVIGGQVGINGHITVGDRVMVGAQSAIANTVPNNQILLGTPAIPYREEQKLLVYRKKLPEIFQRLKEIEKQLKKEE